jgi:hypothetical protein
MITRRDVAKHEAGHTIAAKMFPGSGKVDFVSVIPGEGYTLFDAKSGDFNSHEGLRDNIAMLLAGYVSENLLGMPSEFEKKHQGRFKTDFEEAWELACKVSGISINLNPLPQIDSVLRVLFDELQRTLKALSGKTQEMDGLVNALVEKGQIAF